MLETSLARPRSLAASILLANSQRHSRDFSVFLSKLRINSAVVVSPRLIQRRFMIRPRLHRKLCVLIALTAIWGGSSVTRAEQPPTVTPAPAESKPAPPPRAKPQIIYHLPRSSSYAATLHSQAKTQSHPLPIDSSMPPSLQMSRAAANEAAARAQQERQSTSQKNGNAPQTSPRPKVKRPKMQPHRPQIHRPRPSKGPGPGNSHRNKSRKK